MILSILQCYLLLMKNIVELMDKVASKEGKMEVSENLFLLNKNGEHNFINDACQQLYLHCTMLAKFLNIWILEN